MRRHGETAVRLPAEFSRFLEEDVDVAALRCSAARNQLMFYMKDNVGNEDVVLQLAAFVGAALTTAKGDTKLAAAIELVSDPELKSYMKKIRDGYNRM